MNQKGHVFLIVLLIAAALVGYFIYSGKINLNQKSTQQIAQSTQAPSDETANWKIYTSPKYKYSFKYPSNWTVLDASSGGGSTTEIYSWKGDREAGFDGRQVKKSEILIEILESDNPKHFTVKEWYAQEVTPPKIVKEEEVTINGLLGIKRILDQQDSQDITIDLANEDKIYRIHGIPTDTYLREYELIVSSFRRP